jgi:hypothetical protein
LEAALHSQLDQASNFLLPYLVGSFVEQRDTDRERGVGFCLPFFCRAISNGLKQCFKY